MARGINQANVMPRFWAPAGGDGDITIIAMDTLTSTSSNYFITEIEYSTDGSNALTPLGGIEDINYFGNVLADLLTSERTTGSTGNYIIHIYSGLVVPTHVRQSRSDSGYISSCEIHLWKSDLARTTLSDTSVSFSAIGVSSTGPWESITLV